MLWLFPLLNHSSPSDPAHKCIHKCVKYNQLLGTDRKDYRYNQVKKFCKSFLYRNANCQKQCTSQKVEYYTLLLLYQAILANTRTPITRSTYKKKTSFVHLNRELGTIWASDHRKQAFASSSFTTQHIPHIISTEISATSISIVHFVKQIELSA